MAKRSVKDLAVKRPLNHVHTQTASNGIGIQRAKYLGSMLKNDLGEILQRSLRERKSDLSELPTAMVSKPVPKTPKTKLSRSKSLSDLTTIKRGGAKSKKDLSVEAMNLEKQNGSFSERVRGGGGIYNLRRLSVSTANLTTISPIENVAVRKKSKPFKGSTYSMSLHGSSTKKKKATGRGYSKAKSDVDQTDDEFGSLCGSSSKKKKAKGRGLFKAKSDVDQTDDEFESLRGSSVKKKKAKGRGYSKAKSDIDQTDDEFGTSLRGFSTKKKKAKGRGYAKAKSDIDQTDDEFGTSLRGFSAKKKKAKGRGYAKAKSDMDQTDDEFENDHWESRSLIKYSNSEKEMPILSQSNASNFVLVNTAYSVEPPALEMQIEKSPVRKRKLSRKETKKLDMDNEYFKLCTCHTPDGSHIVSTLTADTFCEGVDCIDDRLIGCVKKISSVTMFRSSVRTTFQALCELHRHRMRIHQSCPQCGQFCIQGTFVQCLADPKKIVHLAHKSCLLTTNGVEVCPHCGQSSHLQTVHLELNAPRTTSFFQTQQLPINNCVGTRMTLTRGMAFKENVMEDDDSVLPSKSCKLSDTGKEISSVGLPAGPERFRLENVIDNLSTKSSSTTKLSADDVFNAAKDGDIEKILQMLMLGLDVNFKLRTSDKQTILHIAAGNGQATLVHILIQAGAAVNAMDNSLRTPIMSAIENGHVNVVQYLIKAGVQLDTRGENALTALHLASKYGLLEVVKNILDTGKVSVNVQDDGGWTPLIWACEFNHIAIVKYVLENDAGFNLRDKEQNIALHWSAFSGSFEISELLLNHGCDVDARNIYGETPLHVAARQDKYECVMLFLSRNADIDVVNKMKDTPIMCCNNQSSQTWMALNMAKSLKRVAGPSVNQLEIVVSNDISRGREAIPIQCVNAIDNEKPPSDYLYIKDNCETFPLTLDRSINRLKCCKCDYDCAGSTSCSCNSASSRCCWYSKTGRLVDEFNYLDPPMVYECNRACHCFTTCSNRVLQKGIKCRLQMFRTKLKGWGIRTLQDIPKGTFICEYVGEVISDLEADQRIDDSYLFDLNNEHRESYCIDARFYGNICRFVNHNCDPNVIPIKVFVDYQDLRFPRMALFSRRPIKAYEELGCDYGSKFWNIKSRLFSCACGSKKCRYSEKSIHQTISNHTRR